MQHQNEEKQRAIKKLMKKWLNAEQTIEKATLLMTKHPLLKRRKGAASAASK